MTRLTSAEILGPKDQETAELRPIKMRVQEANSDVASSTAALEMRVRELKSDVASSTAALDNLKLDPAFQQYVKPLLERQMHLPEQETNIRKEGAAPSSRKFDNAHQKSLSSCKEHLMRHQQQLRSTLKVHATPDSREHTSQKGNTSLNNEHDTMHVPPILAQDSPRRVLTPDSTIESEISSGQLDTNEEDKCNCGSTFFRDDFDEDEWATTLEDFLSQDTRVDQETQQMYKFLDPRNAEAIAAIGLFDKEMLSEIHERVSRHSERISNNEYPRDLVLPAGMYLPGVEKLVQTAFERRGGYDFLKRHQLEPPSSEGAYRREGGAEGDVKVAEPADARQKLRELSRDRIVGLDGSQGARHTLDDYSVAELRDHLHGRDERFPGLKEGESSQCASQ